MSQTIISVFVILASQILPHLGVQIGSDALTTTITTIASIVAAAYIWFRRHQQGDVGAFGGRKQ